jgi:Family of unknown function (DUF5681)
MSERKRDYAVGRGKPPLHSRFKKGQSGNPRGPRPKNLPALLVAALDEKVVVTIDGERREITKREAVATQLVNKSTGAKGRRSAAARARRVHRGRRGGHGDLHRQAAAILGGGASRARHRKNRVGVDWQPGVIRPSRARFRFARYRPLRHHPKLAQSRAGTLSPFFVSQSEGALQ